MDLIDQLATPTNLCLQVCSWALIVGIQRYLPALAQKPWFARIIPILAPAISAFAVLVLPIPEWQALAPAARITLGITLGIGSAWAHKMVLQSLLGQDDRIAPPDQGGQK